MIKVYKIHFFQDSNSVSSHEGETEKDGDDLGKVGKKHLLPKVNAEDFYASKSVHNVIRKREANDDERIDEAYRFKKTYLNMLKSETDTVWVMSTWPAGYAVVVEL